MFIVNILRIKVYIVQLLYNIDIFELADIINKEMTIVKPSTNDKPMIYKDCVNDYIFI